MSGQSNDPGERPNAVRVLVIEDNPAYARLLRIMLEDVPQERFELTAVERIAAAVARLEKERFDLIICDLSLPDCVGLEVCRQLRAAAPATPLIVMTGLDDSEMARRAISEGASAYLVKGIHDNEVMTQTILRAIGRGD